MKPDQIPLAYVQRVAQVESGGNPLAKAPTSSALGLFQFTANTWEGLRRDYPGLGLTPGGRTDPVQAERAFRQFTADNAGVFRRGIGREPSMSELYLCHFLGAGGAVGLCSARQAALVLEVMGERVVKANPFLKGMSCADLRAWARRKVPDALSATPLAPSTPRPVPHLVAHPTEPPSETDRLNDAELERVRRLEAPEQFPA